MRLMGETYTLDTRSSLAVRDTGRGYGGTFAAAQLE